MRRFTHVDAQATEQLERGHHRSFTSDIRGAYANCQIVEGGFDKHGVTFVIHTCFYIIYPQVRLVSHLSSVYIRSSMG